MEWLGPRDLRGVSRLSAAIYDAVAADENDPADFATADE
jgi:hypothetical protein